MKWQARTNSCAPTITIASRIKAIRLLQKNKERYDKKYRFIDALNYVPRFQVRLGQLAKIGVDQNGEPILQQNASI